MIIMGRETDWICIYLMLEKKVVYISVIPLVRISINSSHSFLHTLTSLAMKIILAVFSIHCLSAKKVLEDIREDGPFIDVFFRNEESNFTGGNTAEDL